jgi:hypothetical protein
MGNQLTSTLTCSHFNFPSIPTPNLAWKSKEGVGRALESSGRRQVSSSRRELKCRGWGGIYTPSPKTSSYKVKFWRLQRNLRKLWTPPPETLEICGVSAQVQTPDTFRRNPCPDTLEKLQETHDFSAENTPKIHQVLCEWKVSLIDLLDHLEHLILHKASDFHAPFDSTAFLYSISKV